LWKVRRADAPVLVGTIPAKDAELVRQFPAVTITPLFGGASGIDYRPQSGLRLEGGFWLDEGQRFGLETSFFQLAQGQRDFSATGQGPQAFGPVFHDPAANEQVLIMEAVPGLRAGTVAVDTSQRLWGGEVNAIRRLQGGVLDHIDLLAGFRHLQFAEGFLISGTSRSIPGGRLPCG